MTIREKIEAVRNVRCYEKEISDRLETMLGRILDDSSIEIGDFIMVDDSMKVDYYCSHRGERYVNGITIPIEWLDEGFDYVAAYHERKRKEQEEAEKRIKKERLKEKRRRANAKKRKAENEYKQYLELKKKYEKSAE